MGKYLLTQLINQSLPAGEVAKVVKAVHSLIGLPMDWSGFVLLEYIKRPDIYATLDTLSITSGAASFSGSALWFGIVFCSLRKAMKRKFNSIEDVTLAMNISPFRETLQKIKPDLKISDSYDNIFDQIEVATSVPIMTRLVQDMDGSVSH